MGLKEWIADRFRSREHLPAAPEREGTERPRRPSPTPTSRVPERPQETPTTRSLGRAPGTAGTPTYRSPKSTPSTERLHNRRSFR